MGWARAAVGAGLLLAPGAFLRLSAREAPTPVAVLLMRTIGIRDLVLGVGTIAAARRGGDDDLRRWTAVGLASDSLDVLASVVAAPAIGRVEAVGAAGAALAFAVADGLALGELRTGSVAPGPGGPVG